MVGPGLPRALQGAILLTLKKCEDLASADLNGYSDPYVVMKLGNGKQARQKSTIKHFTLNAEYNEKFEWFKVRCLFSWVGGGGRGGAPGYRDTGCLPLPAHIDQRSGVPRSVMKPARLLWVARGLWAWCCLLLFGSLLLCSSQLCWNMVGHPSSCGGLGI